MSFRDLMAIVSALEYNTFFRGLKVTHARLSHETLDRVLHVLRRSLWLEELHLEALGLRADFLHKLAVAVISNSSPALQTITLSHNLIEDKGMCDSRDGGPFLHIEFDRITFTIRDIYSGQTYSCYILL